MIEIFHQAWNGEAPVFAVMAVGAALVLVYYCIAWWIVGRDPEPGPIIPVYDPPGNLPASAMRYAWHMEFDDQVFAMFILEMARKGLLAIRKRQGRTHSLDFLGWKGKKATRIEKKVLHELFSKTPSMELSRKQSQDRLLKVYEYLERFLKKMILRRMVKDNKEARTVGYILVALSIFFGAASAPDNQPWILFLVSGPYCFALGMVFASFFLNVRDRIRGDRSNIQWRGMLIILILLATLPVVAGLDLSRQMGWEQVVLTWEKASPTGFIWIYGILMMLGAITYLFDYLLKAPTKRAQAIRDEIEGFRLYLEKAEEKHNTPRGLYRPYGSTTPDLRPYVIALGVGRNWTTGLSSSLNFSVSQAIQRRDQNPMGRWIYRQMEKVASRKRGPKRAER